MSRQLNPPLSRHASHSTHHHAYSATMDVDGSHTGPRDTSELLPWDQTQAIHSLFDSQNREVKLDIQAKIDKGFFRAEQDWTCYRRNYFAVACSYSLKLEKSAGDATLPCYLRSVHNGRPVERFAVCIAACVNDDEGKSVELVQHTPKRDKGPVNTPQRTILKPNQSGQLGNVAAPSLVGMYQPSSPYYQSPDGTHYGSGTAPSPPPHPSDEQTTTSFDRIQFKRATANNGKRRAQQQYFHVRVELFAGFSHSPAAHHHQPSLDAKDYEWTKVATRLSAQMVVRGRSPGHYSDSQPQSSTSMGGGSGMGGAPGSSFGGGLGVYGPQNGLAPAQYRYGNSYPHGNSFVGRNIVHQHEVEHHIPPITSCGGLEDSSMSAHGILSGQPNSYHDHQSFSYNVAATQSMGLLSPAFSIPSPSSLTGHSRPHQMMPSPPSMKPDLSRRPDYKAEQPFIPRSDPHSMHHYESDMGSSTWMANNGTPIRDCPLRWPALTSESLRVKNESISSV